MLIIPLYQSVRCARADRAARSRWSLPYTALNLPLAVWMLSGIPAPGPRENWNAAARIDGLLALATALAHPAAARAAPPLAASAMLVFIFCWNEFLLALTFMSRADAWTVPVGIAMLAGSIAYEFPGVRSGGGGAGHDSGGVAGGVCSRAVSSAG